MSRLRESGYARDGAPDTRIWDAVRWWYIHVDGDYTFARGGRVSTSRGARDRLRGAHDELQRDLLRMRGLSKLTHRLGPEGELVPLRRASNG